MRNPLELSLRGKLSAASGAESTAAYIVVQCRSFCWVMILPRDSDLTNSYLRPTHMYLLLQYSSPLWVCIQNTFTLSYVTQVSLAVLRLTLCVYSAKSILYLRCICTGILIAAIRLTGPQCNGNSSQQQKPVCPQIYFVQCRSVSSVISALIAVHLSSAIQCSAQIILECCICCVASHLSYRLCPGGFFSFVFYFNTAQCDVISCRLCSAFCIVRCTAMSLGLGGIFSWWGHTCAINSALLPVY